MTKSINFQKSGSLRVLVVSAFPPPSYGSAIVSKYCVSLLERRDNVRLLAVRLNSTMKYSDIGKWSLKKIWDLIRIFKEIRRACVFLQPSVVYFVPAVRSIGFYRDFLVFLFLRLSMKGEVLIHLHGRLLPESGDSIKRPLMRIMFSRCHVIVLSEALKTDLKHLGSPKSISILPNTVEDSLNGEMVHLRTKITQSFTILFLSNMRVTKGWPILLESCSKLKETGYRFNCLFAGSFPTDNDRKEFQSIVERLELENEVQYLGSVHGKEKHEALMKADSLVLPTELDTFPLVVLEAMMYGVPPTVSRMGALVDVVEHRKNGYVLSKTTSEQLFFSLEEQCLMSETDRTALKAAARRRYETTYSPSIFQDRFLTIIESVGKNRPN